MMRPGRSSILIALALTGSAASALAADKLDGDDKKWLAQVGVLIQPDELSVFKSIPRADRAAFQVIFWARRNPQGPAAPTNEFKDRFLRSAAEADKRFSVPNASGASTSCGHVYLLFGPPDQVTSAGVTAMGMPEMQMGWIEGERLGRSERTPELWIYKDRPGLTFSHGGATIPFDSRCDASAAIFLNQILARLAATKIVTPDVKPQIGPDGHLVKLADVLRHR
jgi:GWxTD domain-containing protein